MLGLIWIQNVDTHTLMVLLKDFFRKVDFEKKTKKQQTTKSMPYCPVGKVLNQDFLHLYKNVGFGNPCTQILCCHNWSIRCAAYDTSCYTYIGLDKCFLILYMFCCRMLTFFPNQKSFRNTISVSNSLDPDQAQQNAQPVLGPNSLQRLSADDKVAASKQRVKL